MSVVLRRASSLTAVRTLATRRVAPQARQLQLWAAPVCPWAQRGYIALREVGTPFDYQRVDLHNKSPEFVQLYRSIVCDEGANAKVPVLLDGDLAITESPVVAEYVLRKYAADDRGIIPAEPAVLARARLFAEMFVSYVTAAQGVLLKANTKAKVADATHNMVAALKVMDAFLLSQGSSQGGSYFLGGQYSIAEVLSTSLLQRAIVYCQAYRGVDLWQLVRANGLARMEAWMTAAVERPSAKATMPDQDELIEHGRKFTVPLRGRQPGAPLGSKK